MPFSKYRETYNEMSSSSDTAYSPNASPKKKDWAEINHEDQGQYGQGPGLKDPNDPIMNSDAAYKQHEQKARDKVGAGPSIRRPSSPGPRYGHFEHREHARSPTLSPPPHENMLQTMPTASTNGTIVSKKTKVEVERESTLSTIRTKLGLEPEPPILDGHDIHHNLTWSGIRVILREPFAEFFGTFVMVCFGDGSVAQVLLSTGQATAPGGNGFGNYQSINWG